MKRRLAFLLTVLGITVSAFAFSGSNLQASDEGCPLRGTPACPEYPRCCK
jgi:hypothetical protein